MKTNPGVLKSAAHQSLMDFGLKLLMCGGAVGSFEDGGQKAKQKGGQSDFYLF